MDLETLWKTALGEIELSVPPAEFITWFKGTSLSQVKDGCATIVVANNFAKEWMEGRCAKTIVTALAKQDPQIKTICCRVGAPKVAENKPRPIDALSKNTSVSTSKLKPFQHKPRPTALNPRYTFANFIVGSHNELAHAAARSITDELGTLYNPLFVYGHVGLGKTHLLQAIGNEIIRKDPDKKIIYISAEKFATELIDAIQNKTIADFKRMYQQIDLLIIDDVQFISGKEKTQDEFFHIFNTLYQKNKQIIISSDRPPQEIATLEDRLRSRFEGGMIADIGQPDLETRVAILQQKAKERNLLLPEDAAIYIASHIGNNVRELEGALNKVAAICDFQNLTPSLKTVEDILSPLINQKTSRVTPQKVIETVCEHFNVSVNDILSKKRQQSIVRPRQFIMYILREQLSCSYPEIGSHCGGRDHTTVMHACRKVEKQLQADREVQETLTALLEKLRFTTV